MSSLGHFLCRILRTYTSLIKLQSVIYSTLLINEPPGRYILDADKICGSRLLQVELLQPANTQVQMWTHAMRLVGIIHRGHKINLQSSGKYGSFGWKSQNIPCCTWSHADFLNIRAVFWGQVQVKSEVEESFINKLQISSKSFRPVNANYTFRIHLLGNINVWIKSSQKLWDDWPSILVIPRAPNTVYQSINKLF